MSTIDPHSSLAALVLDEPARAELLERLGFDYCCGGGRSLAEASEQLDLDLGTVVRVLEEQPVPSTTAAEAYDWRRASTADLCDHIVAVHHGRLRRELPRLRELLTTVVRVHGGSEPRLRDVARVFERLAHELLAHLDREEQVLFPRCRAVAGSVDAVDEPALLDELAHDHADVGEMLLVLRDLTAGYRRESARCGTHRAALEGLRELEHDLHQHIHEENNVLFPRVRGLPAA